MYRSVFLAFEFGKPNTGLVYQIMKSTRHQYHYSVRRCKSNKLNIQKQGLAENIYNSTNFLREIKKINPANKLSTTIMNNANGDKELTSLLVNKYETLYSSTSDHLIYGGHRLHVLLSILFNVMLQHGYNAKDLILSSIISIPKDMQSSLSSSTNYRGISLFNAIGKVFD